MVQTIPVILLVDESESASGIQFILSRSMECEVLCARTADEAFELTCQNHPDIVVFDITSSEVEGFAFCKRIKLDEEFQDIPVMFISARENTQNIVIGLTMGAVDFIRKPYYPKEVVARIQFHLKMRAQQQLIQRQNLQNRELLQVLCHDLMNQHLVLSGMLSLAQRKPEKVPDYLKRMRESLDGVSDIIDLVRQIRAIEDGKTTLQLEAIDVKAAVEKALQIVEERLQAKQVTVYQSLPEGISVFAEKTSFINSVICNLLTNAIKFSFPGGQIAIFCQVLDDKQVELQIQDQGIGMPPHILDNLFSLNKATNRKGTDNEPGTGYGMPLVRKFMSLYGGDIQVESIEKEPGVTDHGTTLFLTFRQA